MRKAKKLLVFIFVFAFVFSTVMSCFVLADSKSADKGKGKPDKEVKTIVKEDKADKTTNEKVLDEKQKQTGDKALFAEQSKKEKEKIKAEIRNNYSNEELNALEEAAQEIEENNGDVDVLPVDSIIAQGKKVKWDTPPVVKEGRILVPVRALTQAYGAEVKWDQEAQKVTIIKDGKEIVIELNSKTVYVDGVAVELDVPAQSINARTVVPLRFIAEQLGLKVNFDDETDTVEIDEDDEAAEDGEGDEAIEDDESTAVNAATDSTTGNDANHEDQNIENDAEEITP